MFYLQEEKNNHVLSVIDGIPSAVFVIDKKGVITYLNKAAKVLFKQDDIPDNTDNINELMKFYDIRDKEDRVVILSKKFFDDMIDMKRIIKDEIVKCIRNDKFGYYSMSILPTSMNNEISGYAITVNDITESYTKELQIKEEREKFISISTELKTKCDIIEILRNREKEHLMHLKDVINNISEGLIVLDNKGKFNFCNKAVYSIIDIKPGEMVYYPNISRRYCITSLDNKVQNLEELFTSSESIRNLVLFMVNKVTAEEKYVEFSINPIVNIKKDFLYTIITLKDVTDIKRHELNAEEQSNFIKNVVETMDIPMAVVGYPSMNIKLANNGFEQIVEHTTGLKLTRGDLLNKKVSEVFYQQKGKRMLQDFEYCSKYLKEYTYSPYEISDYSGEKHFYKIKYKPCKDIYGNMNTINIQAMDITEEINHSMELENITRLKDEFFTIISHELRTPLTIIYSSLQLAYDIYGKELTPNIERTLSRIHQNCSRLLKLINNILDISKAEAGFLTLNPVNFEIVSTTEFIVNSVNSYAKSKGINLIFDTNEEERDVNVDRDKYEKVLLNLLSNAIKFTPEGKSIIVTLELSDEYITLSVKDEGVGIPEDKLDSIFDRFAQVNSSLSRRAEGTGLGLSLVKKLIEMMEGKISVESTIDKGSEFKISFSSEIIGGYQTDQYSMVDTNMNDRINIEFSDIN